MSNMLSTPDKTKSISVKRCYICGEHRNLEALRKLKLNVHHFCPCHDHSTDVVSFVATYTYSFQLNLNYVLQINKIYRETNQPSPVRKYLTPGHKYQPIYQEKTSSRAGSVRTAMCSD